MLRVDILDVAAGAAAAQTERYRHAWSVWSAGRAVRDGSDSRLERPVSRVSTVYETHEVLLKISIRQLSHVNKPRAYAHPCHMVIFRWYRKGGGPTSLSGAAVWNSGLACCQLEVGGTSLCCGATTYCPQLSLSDRWHRCLIDRTSWPTSRQLRCSKAKCRSGKNLLGRVSKIWLTAMYVGTGLVFYQGKLMECVTLALMLE